MRQVRRAHKGDAEAVGARGRLLLRLAAQAEWLGIERGVAANPIDCAVRLAGVEVAKVAAPSAKAASSAESPPAKTSSSAEVSALRAILRTVSLDGIADAVHVEAGQRTYRSRLPADGHRIRAEVGVAGNRGQSRTRIAGHVGRAGLGLGVAPERADQAQVLGPGRGKLANGLRGL